MRPSDSKLGSGIEGEVHATEEHSSAAAPEKGAKSSMVPFKQRFGKQSSTGGQGLSSLNQSQDQGTKATNKGRHSGGSGKNKLEDVLV